MTPIFFIFSVIYLIQWNINGSNCYLNCAVDDGKVFPLGEKIGFNVGNIIHGYGYKAVEHKVKVSNGYILTLFQILPKPTCKKLAYPTCSNVVIFAHGLLCSSFDYVINQKALAFRFADHCFNGFLVNFRATIYSTHTEYNHEQEEYWKFNMDDQIKDIPLIIEYVKNYMNVPRVIYVGHSMGTAFMFGALSQSVPLQKKVCAFIALSPVISYIYSQTSIKISATLTATINSEVFSKPPGVICKPSKEIMIARAHLGKYSFTRSLVYKSFEVVDDQCTHCVNPRELINITSHFPAGSSLETVKQFLQNYDNNYRELRMMDYGRNENLKLYGKDNPPFYNTSKILCTPIFIITTKEDAWISEADVENIISRLPTFKKRLDFTVSSHLCMLWGCNNYDYFTKVIDLLNNCFHSC